jgi:hypothetical protein
MTNDPKFIWRNQETHPLTITAREASDLARRREARTRLMRTVFPSAAALYLAVSIGARIMSDQTGPVPVLSGWIGLVRFVLLMIAVLTIRYHQPFEPIISLNLSTAEFSGVDHYRRELLRQLEYFENAHRWLPGLILVVLFFAAAVTVDPRLGVPMTALSLVFAFIWYAQWKRALPQLRAEVRAAEALRQDR